jgi:competence protein ComFC
VISTVTLCGPWARKIMPQSFPAKLRPWADAALSFIYPEVCALCGKHRALHQDGYVCPECWKQVRFIVPPFCDRCGLPFVGEIEVAFECGNCHEMELHFTSARSAVTARGPVLEAIHHYKYNGHLWYEEFLIGLLRPAAREWFAQERCEALVPVPLFPVKQRERGFNQAERLARRLSSIVNVPMENELLKRTLPTPSQTRLSRSERAENMRNAFALRQQNRIEGGHFVLVDDVFTTGATTSACAKLLLKAGAERVSVWTIARAEFHG